MYQQGPIGFIILLVMQNLHFFFSFQVCHFSESTVSYTKINVDIIYFEITNKLIYDFHLLSAMMNPASRKLEVLFVIYFCSNFLPHRR